MKQEMFWMLSIVCSFIVAVLTFVNIIITIYTTYKWRQLNRRIGIDLTMHKELMNVLCEFVTSIGDDKIKFSREEENRREFPIHIYQNYTNMKNAYQKLNLYIDYCYTNNDNIKIELESVYKKYSEAFESLFEGASITQFCNDHNNEDLKMLDDASKKYDKYNNIVKDDGIKERFFEQLREFVKNETDYVKRN